MTWQGVTCEGINAQSRNTEAPGPSWWQLSCGTGVVTCLDMAASCARASLPGIARQRGWVLAHASAAHGVKSLCLAPSQLTSWLGCMSHLQRHKLKHRHERCLASPGNSVAAALASSQAGICGLEAAAYAGSVLPSAAAGHDVARTVVRHRPGQQCSLCQYQAGLCNMA